MGAQVIGDDVDLAAWGLTGEDLVEELDKLGAIRVTEILH
jgi:hypothetical protein